jgi:large repetitive protein
MMHQILVIWNTISNNNDGINDYFILEGIERFPNNSVCIFNRWGVKVYEVEGYDNDSRSFKGISEGRSTYKQDSELPEGTYFYVLKYTKSNGTVKEKAGYLYINRQ